MFQRREGLQCGTRDEMHRLRFPPHVRRRAAGAHRPVVAGQVSVRFASASQPVILTRSPDSSKAARHAWKAMPFRAGGKSPPGITVAAQSGSLHATSGVEVLGCFNRTGLPLLIGVRVVSRHVDQWCLPKRGL
jgi:hypothetical protein